MLEAIKHDTLKKDTSITHDEHLGIKLKSSRPELAKEVFENTDHWPLVAKFKFRKGNKRLALIDNIRKTHNAHVARLHFVLSGAVEEVALEGDLTLVPFDRVVDERLFPSALHVAHMGQYDRRRGGG